MSLSGYKALISCQAAGTHFGGISHWGKWCHTVVRGCDGGVVGGVGYGGVWSGL